MKLGLLYRTLKDLKLKQIVYRGYYAFRNKYRRYVNHKPLYNLYRKGKPLNFSPYIPNNASYNANTFTFLNQSVSFKNEVDWDYMDNGKLWCYNLNYFDFLNQPDMPEPIGKALMFLLIDKLPTLQNANEPYPISLRGINWVKFVSKHNIESKTIDRYLFSQYRILMDNIEWHLLGNHLLENGFSLLFGAYYFKGSEMLMESKRILFHELVEQTCNDGAHFELSPMYHRIILNRVLDCYNLMINNREVFEDSALENLLLTTAEKMLGWMNALKFRDETQPHFNDSTNGIAAEITQLNEYANELKIKAETTELSDSGYRKMGDEYNEIFVDVGPIGPSYIPGHAHSDSLSFVMCVNGKCAFVDPGISTYSKGKTRSVERSTMFHNTVRLLNFDQSEVWGGFRVGRKANTRIIEDAPNVIVAEHDGYKRWNVFHKRAWNYESGRLFIDDKLKAAKNARVKCSAFYHFHPEVEIIDIKEDKIVTKDFTVKFQGFKDIRVINYPYSFGYNLTKNAKKIEITFERNLKTIIEVEKANS